MKINILIPSKNNCKKLLDNIKKNYFIDSTDLHYLILVDTLEDEIIYSKTLTNLKNKTIIIKKLSFQSDRYIHLLNYKNADLYLIGADDVFFKQTDYIDCNIASSQVLCCENEQKLIVNHPMITNEFKQKVIKLFYEYRFFTLCIDSLISFCSNREERVIIHMKSNHNNFKEKISRQTYRLYISDLLTFLKFLSSKFFKYGNLLRNFFFLFSIVTDLLSAVKNYIVKN